MTFDFDTPVDRTGSSSLKYEARQQYFGREDVMPFWVADMDFAAPEAVTQALVARAQHGVFGYTDYPESVYQAMQAWFNKRHQWSIERDSILLCPGVVPSLYAAVSALTELGDQVIVQTPVYHPFYTAVTDTGRTLVENPLRLEQGRYQIDFDQLRACAVDAKMLILCSPHNPVGRVWQHDELMTLLAIAREHGLFVVSDEIHADLIFPEYQHIPLATLADDVLIITAVSPSKSFNIPGLGLSALVIDDDQQRKQIQQAFAEWHVSNMNPFSIVGFETAYREGEAWLDALMVYLDDSRRAVEQFLLTSLPEIKLVHSEGTYLLWLDCRELGLADKALHRLFINDAKLALSPGTLFGAKTGSGFMRFNIAAPRSVVMSALTALEAALKV